MNYFRPNFFDAAQRLWKRLSHYTKKKIQRSALEKILIDTINTDGPMTIEQYMEIALHHKDYGYYRHGNPLGAQGDFGTAPEISQMFGEVIAVWCIDAWTKLGKPKHFILLELGPGQGTLMYDILRSTISAGDFHDAISIYLLESNKTLRSIQKEKLAQYSPIHIDDLKDLPHLPTIILANEFFDTIPIRQFARTPQFWQEVLVGQNNKILRLERGKEIDIDRPSYSNLDWDHLKEGWTYEMSPQSETIIKQLAAHITQHKGCGLIIDYGYMTAKGSSTLDAWHHNHFTDILDDPGNVDVTADVNFGALQDIITKAPRLTCTVTSQRNFLNDWGINMRAEILMKQSAPEKKMRIKEDLYRLTSSSQMGELWLVMTIGSKS